MSDTQEQERMHMKHCPRCGHKTMFNSNMLNIISKADGKTHVCPNCAKTEYAISVGIAEPDDVDRAFRARLGMAAG